MTHYDIGKIHEKISKSKDDTHLNQIFFTTRLIYAPEVEKWLARSTRFNQSLEGVTFSNENFEV